MQTNEINAWYCMKNQGKSKVIHCIDNFTFGSMSVGMVKTNMYVMTLKYKRNILGEKTNLHTVAYFFSGELCFCFLSLFFFSFSFVILLI